MKYFDDQVINHIRKGYYTAVYFNRTKEILFKENNFNKVVMQIFQKKNDSILCGVDEVWQLLKVGTGYWQNNRWVSGISELNIESLKDGDVLFSGETVMHISGSYLYFVHLESLYLGILARRTLVATNVAKIVRAAGNKSVIFFADRFDHFINQEGDGYAAKVGGASAICTNAQVVGFGQEAVGTIPHSLIAIYNGDAIEAARLFIKYYKKINLIVLVDFDNDCVKTTLEIARRLKNQLWGVRIDTAENMIDKSLWDGSCRESVPKFSSSRPPKADSPFGEEYFGNPSLASPVPVNNHGVNPSLVKNVRKALDQEGFEHVKIVVSGGFNPEKVSFFEKEKTPVDIYGVGSYLVHGENDFTADIVMVEGKKAAKSGREYKIHRRMKKLDLPKLT